ncbi:phage tail protein [Chitinimonas koreensis]|uniref:phage tail protein n=1 Tax=Chitinimonas koreensis TaxID=356302 RepID=UPI0003F86C16|nr:phage tail protein [Chitinimonas koreensis]
MDMLLPSFKFEISLLRSAEVVAGSQRLRGADDRGTPPSGDQLLGNGGFQECTGLEIEMDMQDYQEGGRNNGVIRRAGRAKFQPLVLKRGMFFESGEGEQRANAELWQWMQDVIDGVRPIRRYDGIVYVKSADNAVRATWTFERGLPAKIRGPELNGKTGELAIEELHIAHEGLRLLMPGAGA